MALTDGPVLFLYDDNPKSLTPLPDALALAEGLGQTLTLLHLQNPKDSQEKLGRNRKKLVAALPATARMNLMTIPRDGLLPALRQVTGDGLYPAGMLALSVSRAPQFLHWFSPPSYMRPFRRGPTAIVGLPKKPALNSPIRHVLFPADLAPRSAFALTETFLLCQRLGATLHLLHVFGEDRLLPNEIDQTRRDAVRSPQELLDLDLSQIKELADRATAAGVKTVVETAEGRAHQQILAYTTTAAIQLIVMPSHGTRTFEDVIFGSTTQRVMRSSPVPVLALRA